MMPKRIQLNTIFTNCKKTDNLSESNISNKFQIKNNNSSNHEILLSDEGLIKPKSPILLKRDSLIKYDELIPFADGSDDNSRKPKETKEDKIEKAEKPMCSLFKTGSISSLKISSLKEQWPSSEYVQSGRYKIRTQSTCNEHRCPLPATASNGTTGDHSASFSIRSISAVSSHSDVQLSLSTDKTTLASYLSKCDVRSKSAATDIMKRMDFSGMSLVESLQAFIKKIPVIGESQERDRILAYFTDRFMECNPGVFKNNDVCHTLVCALMLLNTDIHGQVSKKKMTCKEFVDNILTNYPSNDYKESDLINVYNFIRKTELRNDDPTEGMNTLRRKFTKLISKSIRVPRESNSVDLDQNLLNQQHFISGNIMRKCIRRSFGKKPAIGHRGWKLQFASLVGLQMLLFKTNLNRTDSKSNQDNYSCDRLSLTDSNISSELLQNDNSSICLSINNATTKSINSKLPSSCSRENIQVSVEDVDGCIKIHHAFAGVVERLRHKNVFSLRLADQAEYLFKVKSDQLHTWVNSINYAAAILSSPPIVGAGQCGLYKPLLPGYLTDLDKNKQMESHEAQVRHYRENLKKLQLGNSKTRAMNETNIQFCKYEITRFETYLKLLTNFCSDNLYLDHHSTLDPDITSIVSTTIDSASPRIMLKTTAIIPPEPPLQDLTTLRRRPPKIPISQSSTETNHNAVSRRPAPYSPQLITNHLQFTVNTVGARPSPSFSRFIEPVQIQSPLVTGRSDHINNNKLPQYCLPDTASTSSSSLPGHNINHA